MYVVSKCAEPINRVTELLKSFDLFPKPIPAKKSTMQNFSLFHNILGAAANLSTDVSDM